MTMYKPIRIHYRVLTRVTFTGLGKQVCHWNSQVLSPNPAFFVLPHDTL